MGDNLMVHVRNILVQMNNVDNANKILYSLELYQLNH